MIGFDGYEWYRMSSYMGTKDIGVKDDICHDWIYYVGIDTSGVNTSRGIEVVEVRPYGLYVSSHFGVEIWLDSIIIKWDSNDSTGPMSLAPQIEDLGFCAVKKTSWVKNAQKGLL